MTSTFFPEELDKFNRDDWWDKNGPFATLHQINPLRLEWLQRFTTLSQKRLLDVGCGGGILSEELARGGAHVTAIDLATTALASAREHATAAQLNIHYLESSIETLTPDQPFEVITCMEMLEHIPNPEAAVAAMSKLLAPGGWLFLSTINRTPQAFIEAIVGAEYLLKLLPRGTHDWEKFITPATLAAWLREAGLEVAGISGLRYNPLLKTSSLSSNSNVNYLLAAHKPRPLQ